MLWDVIVVGSGPSGATCAWKCAEAGWKTLLLERSPALPRYKPCGGGIPASLARHVPGFEHPEEFADLTVTALRHTWKGHDPVTAIMATSDGTPASVWMVQRPRFDNYLVQKAVTAGATLQTNVRVKEVTRNETAVTLTDFTGNTWQANHVVGADGAKGVVGPSVGLRLGRRYGIAREIELPLEAGKSEEINSDIQPTVARNLTPDTACLDYGTVPNGYAWIFPKGDCLSVGAGMLLPERPDSEAENTIGRTLKTAIDIILASVGRAYPEGNDVPRLWAHPIPFWTGAEPLVTADGRILLVGDAAGVVQPLFGEGIQYAVRSGAIAAQHLVTHTTTRYTDSLRNEFADEFDAALRVGKVFHKTPYLSYQLGVKNPAGTRLIGRIMAGEATFAGLEQRIYERLRKPFGR